MGGSWYRSYPSRRRKIIARSAPRKIGRHFRDRADTKWLSKWISDVYSFRLRMLHGDRRIKSAFRRKDKNVDFRFQEEYDSRLFAVGLLLVLFQEMIIKQCSRLEFLTVIAPSPTGWRRGICQRNPPFIATASLGSKPPASLVGNLALSRSTTPMSYWLCSSSQNCGNGCRNSGRVEPPYRAVIARRPLRIWVIRPAGTPILRARRLALSLRALNSRFSKRPGWIAGADNSTSVEAQVSHSAIAASTNPAGSAQNSRITLKWSVASTRHRSRPYFVSRSSRAPG